MKRSAPLRRRTPLRSDPEKQREWERKSRRNNPLKRRTSLRSRSLSERTEDDPDRYGELFERVREMPCFGRRYLPGHECGLGYAPATAHHLGRKDTEGLVPVCGRLHDLCEERESEVERRLAQAGSPCLDDLGGFYIGLARKAS